MYCKVRPCGNRAGTRPKSPAICCSPRMRRVISSCSSPRIPFRWRPRKSSGNQWQIQFGGGTYYGRGAAARAISLVPASPCPVRWQSCRRLAFRECVVQYLAAGKSPNRRNFGGRLFPMKWFRWWWLLLLVPMAAGLARLHFDSEILDLLPANVRAVQGLKLYQQHFTNARELVDHRPGSGCGCRQKRGPGALRPPCARART